MVKKRGKKLPLFLAVGAILLTLTFFVGVALLFLNIQLPAGLVTGQSTLSLVQGTAYDSSDPFFSSPAYSLVVVADGSSKSNFGTFTPNDVAAFTGDKKPEGNFEILINIENESCTYAINTADAVDVIGWESGVCGFGCTICQDVESTSVFCNQGAGGALWIGRKAGTLYRIDSVANYESNININLETQNDSFDISLSPTKKQNEIEGVLRANFVGSLLGTQSCPVPSADTVLFRPANSNELRPIGIQHLNLYAQFNRNIEFSEVDETNRVVTNMVNAGEPTSSQFCEKSTTFSTEALYKCEPSSSVALPVIKMVVKASVLGEKIPIGMPKIISVEEKTFEPAAVQEIIVRVENTGAETDSFDITISGKTQVSVQATRVILNPREQQDVEVKIEGSGLIGTFNATATSVNAPLNKDNFEFRLMFDPFCDKPAEPGKIKVSTEFGCFYVCPNQHQTDIREKTCQQFGTFETRSTYLTKIQNGTNPDGTPIFIIVKATRGAYSRLEEIGINPDGTSKFRDIDYHNELHCTGQETYTSLNNYMNAVSTDKLTPFMPQSIEDSVWLSAPFCKYVGAYGFSFESGQANLVEELIFDFSIIPESGQEQSIIVSQEEVEAQAEPPTVPENPFEPEVGGGIVKEIPQDILKQLSGKQPKSAFTEIIIFLVAGSITLLLFIGGIVLLKKYLGGTKG